MNLLGSLFIIFLNYYLINITSSECLFEDCKCIKSFADYYDILCIADYTKINESILIPARSNTTNMTNINTFLIKQYRFKTIPDGYFDGLNIKSLIIGENQLENLTTNAFRGVYSLQLLRIIEKNFKHIENDSLTWLNDKLNELGLWQINYNMENIDEFFDEVKKVSSLKILKLMGYGLENFNVTWKSVFSNLTSLSLASNDLTSISPGVFDSATELVSLDLSNNLLSDLELTFEALLPLVYTLKELRLNGNSIEKLIDFPDFENLEILDLSNNKLAELNGTYFSKLTRLSHLYLSENKLQTIEESVFDEQRNLMVLLLNNNYLTHIPNIENLLRLQILDISNQNKQFKKITNYAFQRNEMPSNSLFINLVANEIKEFDDKAFCSSYSNVTEIGGMDISFESLENVSICILRQLRSAMTPKITLKIVEPIDKTATNLTHVCNCQLKQLSSISKINLTGICGYIGDECDDEQENVDELCSEYEKKFDCNEEPIV